MQPPEALSFGMTMLSHAIDSGTSAVGDLLGLDLGVAGALLAVPLTITIILFCAHVPALQPIAILLGGDVDDQS